MIDLKGNVTTCPTFHQVEGEGVSGAALPTLVVVIPLRATMAWAMMKWMTLSNVSS